MAATTQLAYRSLKELCLLDTSPTYQELPGFEKRHENIRCSVYSPCGKYFAWASVSNVLIAEASTGLITAKLDLENVFELNFSPLGTFLITWQRPSKDERGEASKNLSVWNLQSDRQMNGKADCLLIGHFVQKNATRWNLQHTSDEVLCVRAVSNELQIFRSPDLTTPWNRVFIQGVTAFELCPGGTHKVAAFIPERKGLPAMVKIFDVNSAEKALSQRTFFKGDKVQLKWNADGTSLVVLAQTEVDKSGKSYYGETTSYLMSAIGGTEARIDLDKEGPIHDVSWSPTSQHFGVVYGYMPAKTTIFDTRAEPIRDFPLAPRNTIAFSPHGRFVLIAGFGNLAGQMDIYDLQEGYRKVVTIEASNASVCEWSPDGKHILTATTSPRLRVDNGIRIYHVGGNLMYNRNLEELYQVTWRPRPPSQLPLDDPFQLVSMPHESAVTYLGTVKTPSKATGAYRPPGARGQVTPIAFRREDEGGHAVLRNGFSDSSKSRRREVPGAEPVEAPSALGDSPAPDEKATKAAAKNKKKRESKRNKESSGKSRDAGPTLISLVGVKPGEEVVEPPENLTAPETSGGNQRGSLPAGESISEQQAKQGHADDQVQAPNDAVGVDGHSSQDKRVRALLKKLRAIDELRMRRAGGEKLEGTQIKKMESEEGVRKELASLGFSG